MMPASFKEKVKGSMIDTAITADKPGMAPQRIPNSTPRNV